MDKFFNLMYDFFAFAFPGACIIGSLLILKLDSGNLYGQVPISIKQDLWFFSVVLSLVGYIVGYVVNPVARYLLLQKIGFNLYLRLWPKIFYKSTSEEVSKSRENYNALNVFINSDNLSEEFVRIREYSPRNAQYIEFWDMHVKMSLNLAFACIVFLIIIMYNIDKSDIGNKWYFILFVSISTLVAFFSLIGTAVRYSNWWMHDIKETNKLIKKKKLVGNNKS